MKILQNTQSICPICREPLDASYISKDDKVFLIKKCNLHGTFESLIAEKEVDFLRWTTNSVINIPFKKPLIKSNSEKTCPHNCGPCEEHLQTACCVLIEITKRCNQKCSYCFAHAVYDKNKCEDEDEPSILEIERKYDLLLELGEERTFNIQLSGGEPTIRDDLPQIIKMGKDKGFEYIQINTNGIRIAEDANYANILKDSGASAIFLQFDGTNDRIYQTLRNEPLFEIKKKAIKHCKQAGLPVTIVPTIVRNINLENIGSMIKFLLENVDVIKGIHFQPVSFFGRCPDQPSFDGEKYVDYENRVTMFDIMHAIEEQTDGKLKLDDFYPITSGHTLCCFSSTYEKKKDGQINSRISTGKMTRGSSCCESMDPIEIIKKDRDFVLNKWSILNPESSNSCSDCCESNEMSFDHFLNEISNSMFSVSCMAFQDISNLDCERLKRCRVQVLSAEDYLIPFCAYNSIYRK